MVVLMAWKQCKCGKPFEDGGFKTSCPKCYAKSMGANKQNSCPNSQENNERDIHRQVFLKVASQQKQGATPAQIIDYAKELERVYLTWS